LVEKEREMSKLFRMFLVTVALMGVVASATACNSSGGDDAGDDAGSGEQ
jgi:hypothetical protein